MKDAEYRELEKRIRNYLIIHLNEHHCVFPDPVRSVLTDRSNALTYRSAAVQWNYNHLRQTVYEAVHNIFNSKDRSDIYPTAINHLYPISYCFDDVVFNLISMLDYLASLMILIIKGDIAKTIKWNSLQKTLKNDDLEFPKTAAMVREAHNCECLSH